MKNLVVVFAIVALVVYCSGIKLQPAPELSKSVRDIWSDCSKPDDMAKIGSVIITPDPPQEGKNVAVTVTFTTKERVTGGSVKVKVKLGIIPIYDDTLDLCDLVKYVDIMCPIEAGTETKKIIEGIPNFGIHGHITGNAVATDQNDQELVCVDFDLHI